MDFGYFTFPFFVIGASVALYFWQEPRLKQLEENRKKCLEKLNQELTNGTISATRGRVLNFLLHGFEGNKLKMMPIKANRPYKFIISMQILALIFAAVSAFFSTYLKSLKITDWEHFNIDFNSLIVFAMVALCGVSTWFLIDEFRYMRRIIDLFENPEN